jgi:hypothetical protein
MLILGVSGSELRMTRRWTRGALDCCLRAVRASEEGKKRFGRGDEFCTTS